MGNLTLTPHELAPEVDRGGRCRHFNVSSCMHNEKKKKEEVEEATPATHSLQVHLQRNVQDAINISPDLARKQLSFAHYLFIAKIGQISLYIYINRNIYKFPADLVSPHLARSHSY